MLYRSLERCRICGNHRLEPILQLGEQALTGVFPRRATDEVESGPLHLVKCDEAAGGCGLVQLQHSFDPRSMYGMQYGYRSGLNPSMVRHLHHRVRCAMTLAKPCPGDLILDIGSNDATTLKAYGKGFDLVGMDPTGVKFANFYPAHVTLIPDFFSADTFAAKYRGRTAKIVTSLAMFYDLESPLDFVRQIHRVLADDGIWVFEQSYLPLMLRENAYDTICHEHLEYYALRQIKWMLDRAGFVIVDVETNDTNGGSFCVTAAKAGGPFHGNTSRVVRLLAAEDEMGLSTLRPFEAFRQRVFQHREGLRNALRVLRDEGHTVYGYGASTKGNVLLQFCGIGVRDLPAIAEVNEDKFGCFTPGTRIPIRSEAEVRSANPGCLLVLPWHFRHGIVQREADYLNRGGKLLFPLPEIEVMDRRSLARAA